MEPRRYKFRQRRHQANLLLDTVPSEMVSDDKAWDCHPVMIGSYHLDTAVLIMDGLAIGDVILCGISTLKEIPKKINMYCTVNSD